MIYHVGNYSAKNFRSDLTNLYGCLLPRKDVFNIITIVWIYAVFNVEINCCEGFKNCTMFVNDQHLTVTLYSEKVACC